MASEDLVMKFDELLNQFRRELNGIIEDERAKMMAEVQAYIAEKERMEAFGDTDDDIIDLNVGGQKLSTTRSTLCQVEGSSLADMFIRGRSENGLKRDKDGAVFFDFNPQHFVLILDYLRQKKIASTDNPAPLPKVSKDQLQSFTYLVEYLKLKNEIVPTSSEIVPSEKFQIHSPNVALSEDRKVAVHDDNGYGYVLCENVFYQGTVNIQLKLESFEYGKWMYVGVTRADVIVKSTKQENSYGWVLGSDGGFAWKNGSRTSDGAHDARLFKEGDTVELVLDCDRGKLSLGHAHSPAGFHIEIQETTSWRLNVDFWDSNDRIRIMEN